MKNRRPVFALDYIVDAVKNYRLVYYGMQNNEIAYDEDLLKWASGVIQYYFDQVEDHKTIVEARTIFHSISHGFDISAEHVPYCRAKITPSTVTFDDLFSLSRQRRSVRWYTDKPVSRELIEQAVRIASLSPSACNRQPFEFRVFDAEELKNKVGSIPMGIRPFHQQIPVFVVLVGKLSAYLSERDRHVIYIDGGLAAMSFMLALETLGLSSVPINWPDMEKLEQRMEKTIMLDMDERPMMLIGVGYADPDGKIPFSQKKAPNVIIKYN